MNSINRVLLVGLGKMGFKYLDDPSISTSLEYSTHIQVINDHPSFLLHGAVDTSEEAINIFKKRFKIQNVSSRIEDIENLNLVDVLVLATPPIRRYEFLKYFPKLKALIVEKPLGNNLKESKILVDLCKLKNLITQVNFCRRTDPIMRELSKGKLIQEIGPLQCGFGVYGNGILNYAIHTIDLVRMLLGEITKVQALDISNYGNTGPIKNDINIPFILYVNNLPISISPINFSEYREGSLDIWGKHGRCQILQEGLKYQLTKKSPCRSLFQSDELNSDKTIIFDTGFGKSMYFLYDEISKNIKDSSCITSSPLDSCFLNEHIIDCIKLSYSSKGSIIPISID